MDVNYAQGFGWEYKKWVKDREWEHEYDLRKWADNEGIEKAKAQEEALKRDVWPKQADCEKGSAKTAADRINIGWRRAFADSKWEHDDGPNANHPYPRGKPLF
jgi:hypothetical protein